MYICYHFTGSGSGMVIIPLTDGSCVYMLSFTGSGSDIVIIPLTDDSCVYMFSFNEVVLILLSFLSLMVAVYICSLLQEVILILLFPSMMVSVYMFFYRKWFSYCYHSSH